MGVRSQAFGGVAAFSLSLAMSIPAAAEGLWIQTYGSPGNDSYNAGAVGGPLTHSSVSSSAFGSTATFSTLANYGVHKMSTDVQSSAFSDVSNAQSQWYDELQVSSARGGFLIIGMDLTAILTSDPAAQRPPESSFAAFQYQLTAISSLGSSAYATAYNNVTGGSGGFSYIGPHLTDAETVRDSGDTFSRFITLSVAFAGGSDFIYLNSRAICHAQAIGNGVGGTASASCNAGNSVYWGGILGVVDETGAAITDYTLTSASGTDYANSFVPSGAVPEPATWAVMILGFSATGAVLRRRRARPA